MTKKQHYMTRDERYKLEALLEAKIPVSRIAKQLGFCRQTIYNESERGKYVHTCPWWDEERYSAEKAQQLHKYNQTAKGRPLKIGSNHAYAKFLEDKMLGIQADGSIDRRKRYSPAAALAEARKAGFPLTVCVGTLYSYIDKRVFLHLSNKDLWEKGKPKKQGYQKVQRIAHPALPSIINRPESVNQREEYGHWEIDLVVGRSKTRPVLLTMAERQSREPKSAHLFSPRIPAARSMSRSSAALWTMCCGICLGHRAVSAAGRTQTATVCKESITRWPQRNCFQSWARKAQSTSVSGTALPSWGILKGKASQICWARRNLTRNRMEWLPFGSVCMPIA